MLRLSARLLAVLCFGASLLFLSACDSDDPVDPADDGLLDQALADPGTWYFVEVEGAQCRDGSATGFGVRLQEGAEDLVIYLEGGGACFSAETCATNPSSFDAGDFEVVSGQRGDEGIFNRSADNPVGGWNMVYVPYCTGDVHAGSNPNSFGLQDQGVGIQQFVGHLNIERYLDVLAPALDPDRVLLAGASAGGFGSLVNFPEVADTFSDADAYLLDDSGPIFFDDNVLSPPLSGGLIQLYALPTTLGGATELFQPNNDGLQNIYSYLDSNYPDATFGLTSYTEDQTIRTFFSAGQPDPITGAEYEAGLLDIRDRLPESWGTYYVFGDSHTFIGADGTYFGSSDGTALTQWLDALLAGNATDVGP